MVSNGQTVTKGRGCYRGWPCDHGGEISLGKNALIGFMTWEGYNYEDAVLINEKNCPRRYLPSIHIEEYEVEARDTKLGPEKLPAISQT